MNQFNLGNFLNKFVNYTLSNQGGRAPNSPANQNVGFRLTNEALSPSMLSKSMLQSAVLNSFNSSIINNLRMNNLANLERSLYIKDLMNLPKEMEEVLVVIQNKTNAGSELTKLLATDINLSALSDLIQKGGKEAMNKLVLVMAEASKQGIDTSQIKEAIKLINASISVAEQDNAKQVLKSFILLYLPWLPLQEGVDFDLEIESSEGESGESELSITIMISTRNFGNVRVTLILIAGNSMSIFVNCSDKFPKEELLKRIKEESKIHSMQADVIFEQKEIKADKSDEENYTRQAKISMSNLSEVNPFLLMMANAVIRHTIDLDNLFG